MVWILLWDLIRYFAGGQMITEFSVTDVHIICLVVIMCDEKVLI
jgi:hypothetical protein